MKLLNTFKSLLDIANKIIPSFRVIRFNSKVIDYEFRNKTALLYIHLINDSNCDIEIRNISIVDNDKEYPVLLEPALIKVEGGKTQYSPALPFQMNPRTSNYVYLIFRNYEGRSLEIDNLLSLKFQINRKELVINQFLPRKSYYLHNKRRWLHFLFP